LFLFRETFHSGAKYIRLFTRLGQLNLKIILFLFHLEPVSGAFDLAFGRFQKNLVANTLKLLGFSEGNPPLGKEDLRSFPFFASLRETKDGAYEAFSGDCTDGAFWGKILPNSSCCQTCSWN
jgi:hypothetical protein